VLWEVPPGMPLGTLGGAAPALAKSPSLSLLLLQLPGEPRLHGGWMQGGCKAGVVLVGGGCRADS